MGSNPASPTISLRMKRLAPLLIVATVAALPHRVGAVESPVQRVVVEVASPSANSGMLKLVEVVDGVESTVLGPVVARVGRSGVKRDRREGDGTTPLGVVEIVGAFGSMSSPRVRVPYERVTRGDCWISNAADAAYNTVIRRTPCAPPNEDLYRIAMAGPYEFALTTSYNTSPIVPGKGSAIFIHVHSRDSAGRTKPTSGCVSVSRSVMKRLFALLDPAKNPTMVVRVRR